MEPDFEIDLNPEWNEEQGMFEVVISDKETGDADSIHLFAREEKADAFINEWIEKAMKKETK